MTTFAGHWGPEALINTAGSPYLSVAYTVFLAGTSTPATLYADRTKGSTVSNPGRTTDAKGNASFFADPGSYDLSILGVVVLPGLTVGADDADLTVPPGSYVAARPQTIVLGPGDSIMANGWAQPGPLPTDPGGNSGNGNSVSVGAFTWAQMLLRDRFQVVGVAAAGGQTLQGWLTPGAYLTQLTALIASKPRFMLVHIGTNDLGAGARTAAQLIADFETLFALAATAGVDVVVGTILPRGSGNALSGTAEGYRIKVNNYLKAAPVTHKGVLCVDWATPMTTGFAGACTSSLFIDGLHPNSAGAQIMGKALADVLGPVSVPAENLPENNADPANLLTNGLMAGNNGSGLATPGWSIINGSPTATYTASKVARTDGPGEWQKINITVAGQLAVQVAGLAVTGVVPGHRYVGELTWRNAAFTQIDDFRLYTLLLATGVTGQANVVTNGPITAATFPASGVIRTPITFATVANDSLYFQFWLGGVGSVEFTQCRFRDIDA